MSDSQICLTQSDILGIWPWHSETMWPGGNPTEVLGFPRSGSGALLPGLLPAQVCCWGGCVRNTMFLQYWLSAIKPSDSPFLTCSSLECRVGTVQPLPALFTPNTCPNKTVFTAFPSKPYVSRGVKKYLWQNGRILRGLWAAETS